MAPKGKYIAFVLTEAETDNPEAELKPGVDLLGPVDEIFYETYDRYKPTNDCDSEHCYISMVKYHILLSFALCYHGFGCLISLCCRVMIRPRTLSPPWKMFWLCTPR